MAQYVEKTELHQVESMPHKGADIQYDGTVPYGGMKMTPDELKLNRRVNLKMDLLVLPVMSMLYLMSGIDRSNVGNAATVNFAADVGMPSTAVNNASTLFFITFVLFQPISAAFGKQLGVKIWVPILMLGWGTFTLAHAWVQNEGMLIGFRLMIGVFEAGFYPSAVFFLSACYIRYDLALRIALFYGTYAIAGAFSGILAYGLFQIQGALHPWQYLFIFEGALTLFFAVVCALWLPWHISTAWFLNAEERAWAKERMERDSGGQDNATLGISRIDIIEALKDWKFWAILPLNIASSVPNTTFSIFLPVIVSGLGYTGIYANLFSVPIYVIGAVGLWIMAYSSDRFKDRSWHIIVSLVFVFVGLILTCQLSSNSGRYAALCILQIGSYTASPLTITWLAGNTPVPGKRAIVLGLNGFGNLAGVIGSQLFRSDYAPLYRLPFYVSLGLNIFAILGYTAYRYGLLYVNKRRARIISTWTPEQIARENTDNVRLGDKKLTFVFCT